MSEIQASPLLVEPELSREYDLEALRAFDEKYPEYAFDTFLGCPDPVSTNQKAVQVDEGPKDGQTQCGASNEKMQWVEKNDYFNDQDVAAIFENAVAGIESSIIESSVIGKHEVDLSGNAQVPLPSWALDTNGQKMAGEDCQHFPQDFDSFEQEHWDFYTNEILKDETLMTKEWDDLVSWFHESWIKFKAEEKRANAAKAARASEERFHVNQGQNDQDSNSTPQGSEPRSHLRKGRVQHPMAPPQRNRTNGAAPSPYQNTNPSGGISQVPSVGNNQHMSSQKTPCHPGLHHSQRNHNGGVSRVQAPVQQGYDPKAHHQQPHGPPTGYTNNGQNTPFIHRQGVVQGRQGTPKPQRQQSHDPPIYRTNNGQPIPPAQYNALVQGNIGTPRVQIQQIHDPSVGYVNSGQSTPPLRQQGFAPGMNGAPRVPHQQPRGPHTGLTTYSQSTPPVRQQGFAQGTNGIPRAQNQQLPGPPTGLTNNTQSTPPVQHHGSVQGMRSTPGNQLSTLGPGGRTHRKVPRQILGRRGRETTEDDDDVVELDPSVYASQTSEDGSRSKRRRTDPNFLTGIEARSQRRQNGSTSRPQYYGVAGAPNPIVLPEELSRNTRPTSGFVGNAMQPCVPPKAIDSNGRPASSRQGSQAPIQVLSNGGPSLNQQAGHDGLAAGRMNGGRGTNVSGNYLGSLQRTSGAHQGQQISGKRSREELVGGLRQDTFDTQKSNGAEGQEEGNGDRRKQAPHGRNATIGPPQLPTGGLSHPPPVPEPSYPQQPGRILGEVLDNCGLQPGGDVPPKISRKRARSESMNKHQEESQCPTAKRRRTPSTEEPNVPPEAPRREKGKRPKPKQDEHLPPPAFNIDDSGQDASHTPRTDATTEQTDEQISANAQLPHVANAQAPDPPNTPPTTHPDEFPPTDIRDQPPTTEWDCIRLTQALEHTRWAYEQWTGTDAPPTNRVESYNAQFATILDAFGKWWHSDSNPERMLTMEWLVQLDPWEGGVADWKEPGKDGLWWECVRRGFYAGRGADGGLLEPDFRWDVRDYEWYKGVDEEGVV